MNLSSVPGCQDAGFLSADVGDTVTLPCPYRDGRATVLSWYKQATGKKLKLMSNFFLYGEEAFFFGEFRNGTRFQLATKNLQHRLTISDVRVSDSATYYCVGSNFFEYEFRDGTTVSVKGSGLNVPTSVRRAASGAYWHVHSGDSPVLNCTVHTEISDEEHGVYSFRTCRESPPGLIYTTRNTNNNNTKTCFYDLPIQNLNGSQTGADYCAVAACGHILFGDGTKLEFEGELHSN